MHDDDVSRLEAALVKMTPGEWTTSREDIDSYCVNDDDPKLGVQPVAYVYRKPEQRIGVFGDKFRDDSCAIALAVNLAPTLVKELKELRAERDAMKGLLAHLPQTADGYPIIPGAEVFYLEGSRVECSVVRSIGKDKRVSVRDSAGPMKIPAEQCFNFESAALAS